MTVKEALQTLIDYNNWRRDNEVPSKYKMPDPSKIGEAIDVAIYILEHLNVMDYIYSIFVAINGDGYNAGDYERGPEAEAAAEEEAEQLRAALKAGYLRAAGAEVIITRAPAGRDWLEPKDWEVIKRIKIEL